MGFEGSKVTRIPFNSGTNYLIFRVTFEPLYMITVISLLGLQIAIILIPSRMMIIMRFG